MNEGQITLPKVSIVLPVYNAAEFLVAAIDSIRQQNFEDYECIAIDDGSTDESGKLLDEVSNQDSRWKIIHQQNSGLVSALNAGISHARGEYIARMDADDISLPERLKQQFQFLENHPDVGLLGCSYGVIDKPGHVVGSEPVLLYDRELRLSLLHTHTFAHGSVMIRTSVLRQVSQPPYQATVGYVEDIDLWTRIARVSKLASVPNILYLWRKNPESISHTKYKTQRSQAQAVYRQYKGTIPWHALAKTVSWNDFRRYQTKHEIILGQQITVHYRRAVSYHLVQISKLVGYGDLILSLRLLWFAFWMDPKFFLRGVLLKLLHKKT